MKNESARMQKMEIGEDERHRNCLEVVKYGQNNTLLR